MAADVLGKRGGRVKASAWRSGSAVAEAGAGQGGRARDAVGTRRAAPRKKGVRGGAGEVEEVAGLLSPATGRRYPVALVCAVWRVARSTVYARRLDEPRLENVARSGPTSDDRGVGRHR